MKGRALGADLGCSAAAVAPPLYYKYLKPGALAQLRYSKITARSKRLGAQALHALAQLNSSSGSPSSHLHSPDLALNGVPCFNFRVTKYPRCIQRKKLVAARPFFCQTQS